MRSSKFTGTGMVFRFTLVQYLKSKATIAAMLVMMVALVASIFIAGHSMSAGEEHTGLGSVSITNHTGHDISASDIAVCAPSFSGLIEVSPDAADALLTIGRDDTGYIITAQGDVSQEVLTSLEQAALAAFDIVRMGGKPMAGRAMTLEDYMETDDETGFEAVFTVSYVYSIIVLMLVMFSTSYIIRSVVEEKASRLVETLMLSVKPMSLILGKVLAAMCLVLIQLALLAGGAYGAAKLMNSISGVSIVNMVNATGAGALLSELDAQTIIAALISVMLGFFTFSLIGALSASCCSSMDDINSASTATVLTALAGYMAAMVAIAFEGPAATVFSLIPFVSVFVAPMKFLEGSISWGVLLGAWALQTGVIALLATCCRRVYTALLLHTGSRIRFRQLLKLAGKGETK